MARLRYRYTDPADAEAYPGWFEVDPGDVMDCDTGLLMEVEAATGYVVMDFADESGRGFFAAISRREVKAMLASQFLAVRAGGVDVRWADFRPKVMQIEVDTSTVDGDGDGPGNGPGPNRATRRATRSPAKKSARSSRTTTSG